MSVTPVFDAFNNHGLKQDASTISEVNGLPFYKPTPADITINNRTAEDKKKIFFKNVQLFDSTGSDLHLSNVLVELDKISRVGNFDFTPDKDTLVIDGEGKKTLMSGLVDAHTHLSWNDSPTLDGLTSLPIEEHVLHTAQSAKKYLDCGYTMCFGAASARPRLDLVVKKFIKNGSLPGPRTLANCQEITTTGGAIVPSISRYADGPDMMRKIVREFIELGVDNVKLSMTGDYVHDTMGSEETYYTLSETKAAVEEAHNRGKRVCAHARSAASVRLCALSGVDVIYHASYTDAEGMDMLEKLKDRIFVAPAINFPLASCTGEATAYGLTPEMAVKKGLKHEVDYTCKVMSEMRDRGIRVLPGGDYGFAWAPHGTYAKDLAHFVNLFGYTPKQSLIAATALGGELMGHPDVLGKVKPGYFADLLLIDGNPLENIEIFQDLSKLQVIVINGHVHKNLL